MGPNSILRSQELSLDLIQRYFCRLNSLEVGGCFTPVVTDTLTHFFFFFALTAVCYALARADDSFRADGNELMLIPCLWRVQTSPDPHFQIQTQGRFYANALSISNLIQTKYPHRPSPRHPPTGWGWVWEPTDRFGWRELQST